MSGLVAAVLLVGAASRPAVAVLAVGRDAEATGGLQAGIESRLRNLPDLDLLPSQRVAAKLGVVAEAERPSYDRVRGAVFLAAIRRALAEDRRADAFLFLGELDGMMEASSDPPLEDRIASGLWRVSALLSIEERARARVEARALLALDPRLKVDTAVFRPSVATLIEEARAGGLPEIPLTVTGLPEGGTLQIDGRPSPSNLRLVSGHHLLRAAADGYRPVIRPFDIVAEMSLAAGLPVAFGPRLAVELEGILRDPGRASRASLDRLAVDLGVQALVIVAPSASPVLWRRGAVAPLAGPAGEEAVVGDWLVARLSEPSTRVRPPGLLRRAQELLSGGVGSIGWSTSLRTERMAGDQQSFWGGGPVLAAELSPYSWKGLSGWAELGWTDDQVVPRPVPGGTTLSVKAGAGWRGWVGGPESPHALEVTGLADLHWEDLEAFAPADAEGGLFPSHRWLSLEAGFRLALPLELRTQKGGLLLEGAAAPLSLWNESPDGASGSQPGLLGVESYRWGAGVWWVAPRGWTLGGIWREEWTRVGYGGTGGAVVTPPLTDARREIELRAMVLSLRRAF